MKQVTPIILAILTFIVLSVGVFFFVVILNLFPIHEKIVPAVLITGIIVGLTIYLKTSVDFAIFIGTLMSSYPGMKNRITIEAGTAFGNFFGTIFVLTVWAFFKEIKILLLAMIFVASIILLGMARSGLEELFSSSFFLKFPPKINFSFKPTGKNLFFLSISIPLALGLDDFAGYIPLFTIVNVLGFAIGVLLGQMLLNIALFASPNTTTKFVKQPTILFLGSVVFIGIGAYGIWEVISGLLALH